MRTMAAFLTVALLEAITLVPAALSSSMIPIPASPDPTPARSHSAPACIGSYASDLHATPPASHARRQQTSGEAVGEGETRTSACQAAQDQAVADATSACRAQYSVLACRCSEDEDDGYWDCTARWRCANDSRRFSSTDFGFRGD